MIEGVSRPVYDGFTHKIDLEQFLVKHGMVEFKTTAMPATTLNIVEGVVHTFQSEVSCTT